MFDIAKWRESERDCGLFARIGAWISRVLHAHNQITRDELLTQLAGPHQERVLRKQSIINHYFPGVFSHFLN